MKRAITMLLAALVGLLLSGAILAVLVPRNPDRYGPGTAALLTLGCVVAMVVVAALSTGPRTPRPE